jgi:hypothetical protein
MAGDTVAFNLAEYHPVSIWGISLVSQVRLVSLCNTQCRRVWVQYWVQLQRPTVCLPLAWRHHPADALPRRLLLAVVRSQISSLPSADSAAAAALDITQNFFGLEAINRKLPEMMTGPVALTLAEAIDKQLVNAVSADGGDGDRTSHRHISPRLQVIEKSRSVSAIAAAPSSV